MASHELTRPRAGAIAGMVVALGLAAGFVATRAALAAAPLQAHAEAIGRTLDPRAQAALHAIDDPGRRLLAMRAYLRSARQIDARWSWTRAELAAFEGSPAEARYQAIVARVRCVFEARNPGYSLHVNPQVRSLEEQLRAWNSNDSVGRAAARMQAELARAVDRPGFPRAGSAAARDAFRALLVGHAPRPTPTLAAPGLSRHGRMQAIDFQVSRGAQIVAAPRTATVAQVWHAGGWSARLATAVRLAGAGLRGPLRDPDEPWHYELETQTLGGQVRFARLAPTAGFACS